MKKRKGIIASILCVAMLVSGLVVGQFDGMNMVEAETSTTAAVPAYRVGWPTDSKYEDTYRNATLFSLDDAGITGCSMTYNDVKTFDTGSDTIGATKWGVSEALYFPLSNYNKTGMLSVLTHTNDLANVSFFKDYYEKATYTPSSMSFCMSRFNDADTYHASNTNESKHNGMYIVYAVSEPNPVEETETYTKYETTLYCADIGIDKETAENSDYQLLFRTHKNITVTECIYTDGTDSTVALNTMKNNTKTTRIAFDNCNITGYNPNEETGTVNMYEMFQVTLSYGDGGATNPIFNICAKYQVDGVDKEFSLVYEPTLSITGNVKKAVGFRAATGQSPSSTSTETSGLYIADPKVTYDISSYTGGSLPQAVGATLATTVEEGEDGTNSVKSKMQFDYTAAQTQLRDYSDISYGAVLTRTTNTTTYDTLVNAAINQIEGSTWKSAGSSFQNSGYTVTKRTGALPTGYYVTVKNSETSNGVDTSGYRTSTLGYVIGKNSNGAVEYYFTKGVQNQESSEWMNHSVVSLLQAIFNKTYLPENCTDSDSDGTYDLINANSLLETALKQYNSDNNSSAVLSDILEAAGGSTSGSKANTTNEIPKRTLLKSLHYNLYSNESTSN